MKLYYRQCDQCKKGISKGYIYHGGDLYFCIGRGDICIKKYFGNKKAFTSLEDWNDTSSAGLTWDEFSAHWDKIEDNSYAYAFALDICSYTEWSEGCEIAEVYDSNGKSYDYDLVADNPNYELVDGDIV